MKIAFVAGFGPIVRNIAESRAFYGDGLGIALEEISTNYYGNDDLGGVNAFALWPLSQAAESCFGTDAWPDDVPAPYAWLEFDLESADAVAPAAAEMTERGHRLLDRGALGPDRGQAAEPGRDPGRPDLHTLDAPDRNRLRGDRCAR
jgi:catechol 2,3-dioxygenase-like lactoylglutathione lyase family enzyme